MDASCNLISMLMIATCARPVRKNSNKKTTSGKKPLLKRLWKKTPPSPRDSMTKNLLLTIVVLLPAGVIRPVLLSVEASLLHGLYVGFQLMRRLFGLGAPRMSTPTFERRVHERSAAASELVQSMFLCSIGEWISGCLDALQIKRRPCM